MTEGTVEIQPGKRNIGIDQFRGLAILLMVLANFLAGVNWIPAWLKHAPDIGLTVIDLIAPMFIFAIGLTYFLSFERRISQYGNKATIQHFLTRFLAILGIGAILSAGERLFGISTQSMDWGVLQAIGIAGLVTLMFIRLPIYWRAIIGVLILTGYQVLLDNFWLNAVLGSPHGGLLGSISWSGLLLLSTCFAEIYHDQKKYHYFPWIAFATLAMGMIMAVWLPVSKNRVSSSYVVISLAVSAALFWVFHLINWKQNGGISFLDTWGRNPLVLYVMHLILIGIVFLPGIPALYEEAPVWLTLIETAVLLTALTFIARFLERKGWTLSL
jgi:predicted acyltransferase